MNKILSALAATALLSGVANGTTFNITAERVGAGQINPGDTIDYRIVVQLSEDNTNPVTGNEGLALIGFDLSFDGGHLGQADAPTTAPMTSFVNNVGVANPAGYGGTIDNSGTFDVLRQVGGAQNTIKNFSNPNNPPYPTGAVTTSVAWPGAPQVVVTGSLTAPGVGNYTLTISGARANVIAAGEDGTVFWATKKALVNVSTDLAIEVVLATYVLSTPDSSQPGDQTLHETLWRTQKNVIRFVFDTDISLPGAGNVEIRELQDAGAYGPDLSASFAFTVENDGGGDPRILRIADTGSTIAHQEWYAITNNGWSGVEPFERHYASDHGDATGDGLVQFADMAFVNSQINQPVADDQDRHDVNGDNLIQFADLAAVNATINQHASPKPSGH